MFKTLIQVQPDRFVATLEAAEPKLHHQGFLAASWEHDWDQARCWLLDCGNAGFAVTDGWLGPVFATPKAQGFVHEYGKVMAREADRLQCIVTDRYGDALVNLYARELGFVPVASTIDDRRLLLDFYGLGNPRALAGYGNIRHVFMVKPCLQVSPVRFEDWAAAWEYVDHLGRSETRTQLTEASPQLHMLSDE